MSAVTRVAGKTIDFPGGALVVPPLSLSSVEALGPVLASYSGTLADVSIVIDSLTHALKRNYPTMTREEVGELVDMANMGEVMEAVMNVSGLRAKAGESGGVAAAS